jgi:osmotically-inducible protein OsmY
MVRVSKVASDSATAWRIRDALAMHPLLGGATAHIHVTADYGSITLDGWVMDEDLNALAVRLALRAAGGRPVQPRLQSRQCSLR